MRLPAACPDMGYPYPDAPRHPVSKRWWCESCQVAVSIREELRVKARCWCCHGPMVPEVLFRRPTSSASLRRRTA